MGLITQEVEVLLSGSNIKWYKEKGYDLPKKKISKNKIVIDKTIPLKVQIQDLNKNSSVKVVVSCDNSECAVINKIKWADYNKSIIKNNKYYCNKCATKLFASKRANKTKLKKSKSFEQWCYDNLSKKEASEIILRWDIDKNGCKSSEVGYGSSGVNQQGYWFKCLDHPEHWSELKNISSFIRNTTKKNIQCNQCNSFEQWCLDTNRQDILNQWDYDKNTKTPREIAGFCNKKFYFKCLRNIHESKLISLSSIRINEKDIVSCEECNSFEYWCIKNKRNDLLNLWDFKRNKITPNKVFINTKKKYWIKCPNEAHDSELKVIINVIKTNSKFSCTKCNSIAQYLIDNYEDCELSKYWDYEKNNELGLDPWKIAKSGDEYIYIKCQEKGYHGSYKISCANFYKGKRCPYCSSRKIHHDDSLGKLLNDRNLLHLWSDKNKKSPYTHSCNQGVKVWWKCHNNTHMDYHRLISGSNKRDFRCPQCEFSKGETAITEYFMTYGIKYKPQISFKELLGLGGGLLSYDFYLPKYNLLIEYQGEQHEKFVKGFHLDKNAFLKQQEHDRRKREYAEKNNINLLEIWYWDYDNIEQILTKTLSELSSEAKE